MKIIILILISISLLGCANKRIKLKSEEVQKEVAKRNPQIKMCFFEAHSERAVDVYKPVTIKFYIGNLGGVRSASIFKNETGDKKLGECLTEQFAKLKFNVEKGHKNYRYLYTLIYNPRYQ